MIEDLTALSWHPYLDASELVAEGYVQEANRRFFHPLGLHLHLGRADGPLAIRGIIDCRNEIGGVAFSTGARVLSDERRDLARKLARDWVERGRDRLDLCGWMVQPVEEL